VELATDISKIFVSELCQRIGSELLRNVVCSRGVGSDSRFRNRNCNGVSASPGVGIAIAALRLQFTFNDVV